MVDAEHADVEPRDDWPSQQGSMLATIDDLQATVKLLCSDSKKAYLLATITNLQELVRVLCLDQKREARAEFNALFPFVAPPAERVIYES